MRSPLILRIYRNDKLVEVRQFDSDQIIIGHGADVQLDLRDDQVSPIHCLIELRDSGFYLSDLGSKNGTFRNAKQVLDEPLSSGDKIGIGPYSIQFFVGVPKVQASGSSSAGLSTSMAPPAAPVSTPVAASVTTPAAKEKPSIVSPPAPKIREAVIPVTAHATSTSEIKDLRNYLRPGKGPWVEVLVAWRERVLDTHHVKTEGVFTMGGVGCDFFVPQDMINGKINFLDTRGGVKLLIPVALIAESLTLTGRASEEQMTQAGKATRSTAGLSIRLDQNELLALSTIDGTLQIFVRFCEAPSAAVTSDSDVTAGELTSLFVSMIVVGLLAIYMSVFAPNPADQEKKEEQLRLAQFIYNKPDEPKPEPTHKVKVDENAKNTNKPVEVKVSDKADAPKGEKEKPAVEQNPAKAAEVRAIPNSKNKPKKFTSAVKQGGAVKLGAQEGANAASKDVSKSGLLSAFGGGGMRGQLDQAYQGAGDLLGMAEKATGSSGMGENRAGNDLGSKFKDTGAGGKGTATQGISGIGTKGRSSGQSEYGDVGIGGKGSVAIDAGGMGAEWTGTIDREAVRRVIRSILSQIKSCYERQLRSHPELEGKVVINFEIYTKGQVRVATPKEAPGLLRPVAECVAARIKDQRFPEPPEGSFASVDFPFVFGAQK